MTPESAVEIVRSLITTSLMVLGPIVAVAILVGVSVSLIQAVTSVQEQTLTFVPKLIAVGAVIALGAPWILQQLLQFAVSYLERLPEMVR